MATSWADLERAQAEIRMTGSQLVEIEDDLLRAVDRPQSSAMDGILFPGLRPAVVPMVAVAVGNLQIGLLDPSQHLVVQTMFETRPAAPSR